MRWICAIEILVALILMLVKMRNGIRTGTGHLPSTTTPTRGTLTLGMATSPTSARTARPWSEGSANLPFNHLTIQQFLRIFLLWH